MRALKIIPRHLPLIITALLILALFPLSKRTWIPLNFDWPAFFVTYWVSLSLQSVFVSSLLHLVAFSVSKTPKVSWQRYWNKKARLIIVVFLLIDSIWLIGLAKFLIVGLAGLTILEFESRELKGKLSAQIRI